VWGVGVPEPRMITRGGIKFSRELRWSPPDAECPGKRVGGGYIK
jgi:hypothetical protein